VNSLAIMLDSIIGVVDINDNSFNQINFYLDTANKIRTIRDITKSAGSFTGILLSDLNGTDISISNLDNYGRQLLSLSNIYGNETYIDCIDKLKNYINKSQ
jgi:hypothetical protein